MSTDNYKISDSNLIMKEWRKLIDFRKITANRLEVLHNLMLEKNVEGYPKWLHTWFVETIDALSGSVYPEEMEQK